MNTLKRFTANMVLGVVILASAAVSAAAAADAAGVDGWIPVFNGRSLDGWKASENPGSFKVVDGQIACDGQRAHLFYCGELRAADFRNFEFEAEVMTRPGANSGVYFHTAYQEKGFPAQGFEVQVNNSALGEGSYRELKRSGSLYGVRNQYKALARDNEWFKLKFSVRGKRVLVWLNGIQLVDYVEPSDPVISAARPGRALGHGTFALQCHDPGSKVFFRSLRVRPLPDDLQEPATPPNVDRAYRELLDLQAANFPVVNFHVHLKGGLTLAQALESSRRTGINYGIAVNCGLGFGVTNDAGVRQYLESMQGQPAFVGMQAEGREWVKLFSPEAIAKFDYVFTDSMTFTDPRGKRMRLWIKDEVEVPDKEDFMDLLVERTVQILNSEPIDIYVNPTFLPDVIAAEYDALWTRERMQKVIDAAAKNGVAIEINARYRLPRLPFLRLAKAAGLKFSLGTNNGDAQVGDLDYGLEMIRQLNLTWKDMFMPKPEGQKPVQVRQRQ